VSNMAHIAALHSDREQHPSAGFHCTTHCTTLYRTLTRLHLHVLGVIGQVGLVGSGDYDMRFYPRRRGQPLEETHRGRGKSIASNVFTRFWQYSCSAP
jgi:hypothetical protein